MLPVWMEKLKRYVKIHKILLLVFICILIYVVLLSYGSVLKNDLYLTTAWDLGIYEQGIWSTTNTGRFFYYTVELPMNPNGCFFGIHFSPVLFLVLPVYKLFQSTVSLLVFQSLVIGLGAVPLYFIALRETKDEKYALFFAVLYLIYLPLLGLNLFDFHTQAFLPLFFFSAFYYFGNKNFLRYFLFIILALSVVEFVPFIVIFFGLYGLWTARKEVKQSGEGLTRRFLLNRTALVSIFTIILAIGWYILARSVIFYFNPTVLPHGNWAQIGDPVHDPLGLLWNIVANPAQTFNLISASAWLKAIYLFGLLAPVGFVSLLDPPTLLIGTPWFLAAFLSNYAPYYSAIGYQYVGFVIPFVFISAARGGKKLLDLYYRFDQSRLKSLRRFSPFAGKKSLAFFCISIIVVFYGITFYGPHVDFLLSRMSSRSQQHLNALNRILDLVPSGASIITHDEIFPHISQRLDSYVMWEWDIPIVGNLSAVDFYLKNETIDYILVDTTSVWYRENIDILASKSIKNGYGIYVSADYIWLLKKDYVNQSSQSVVENSVSLDLYNQGLQLTARNDSFHGNPPLFVENALNISVSDTLYQRLAPYWAGSTLYISWEGWLYAPEDGEYSFFVLSNSSSPRQLSIDGNVILSSQDLLAKQTLATGFHSLEFDYEIEQNNESLFLFWQPPWGRAPQILGSDFLYPSRFPTVSTVIFSIPFNFGYKSPCPAINRNYFSENITGFLKTETAGLYNFSVAADNRTLVYMDDSLVYSSYKDSDNVFSLQLSSGRHKISIFFVELEGDASLDFLWQPPSQSKFEEIPYSALSP